MRVLYFLLAVAFVIMGFNATKDSGSKSDEAVAAVEPATENAPEAKSDPEPAQLPTTRVRVYRASGDPIVILCAKVSDMATTLPALYGEGLRGIGIARELGWCIGADQNEILRVTDEYWDVHKHPIEGNWPDWFPYLIKVSTEDEREWWVREDQLERDSIPLE